MKKSVGHIKSKSQIEVETLKAEIEILKEKNKELDFQKSRLIIELDELSSDYLGKMELIQSLESENEKQFSRINSLLIEKNELKNELSDALEKIDSLGDEIYLFKQVIHQLTK